MTRRQTAFWSLCAALAAMSFAIDGAVEPDAKPQPPTEPLAGDSKDRLREPPKFIGNESCTAANCHGGLTPEHGIGGEYSRWLQRDPHSRAYSVLFNDLSLRMIDQLQSNRPAHEHITCLRCHSPSTIGSDQRQILDGVGCEQCHGPAEQWVDTHTHPKWKSSLMAEKKWRGFRDLNDLSERAKTCVECHNGVNHDLIAAGHPRLFFELSAFHANMPSHWSPERDWAHHIPGTMLDANPPRPIAAVDLRKGRANFEAKLWVAGQLEMLRATVHQLETSASWTMQNEPLMPWPELAQWNCFACHHDLHGASWRQSRSAKTLAISRPSWNSWPIALADFLPTANQDLHAASARDALERLRVLMSRPYPPPQQVYESSRAARDEFGHWIAAWQSQAAGAPITSETIAAWLKRLTGVEGEQRLAENWDAATQIYLAASALTHALHAVDDPADKSAESRRKARLAILDSLADGLNFPAEFSSPRSFDTTTIDRLRGDLKKLNELLPADGPSR